VESGQAFKSGTRLRVGGEGFGGEVGVGTAVRLMVQSGDSEISEVIEIFSGFMTVQEVIMFQFLYMSHYKRCIRP
jgi:hypothetical protein